MRTMRQHDATAHGAAPEHAALPAALRSSAAAVVLGVAIRLSHVVCLVPRAHGPPGAPRRDSDPPRPVERPALYGMPPADDGGTNRNPLRLPRWDTRIRPA